MKVEFDESFAKSILKIKNKSISQKIEKLIDEIENAATLSEIRQIKKLQGFKTFYRIRIGDYRVGVELLNENTLELIIISHRKEIYNKFP